MEELPSTGDWAPEAFEAACFEVFVTFFVLIVFSSVCVF